MLDLYTVLLLRTVSNKDEHITENMQSATQ